MARSSTQTFAAYLAAQPAERRASLTRVRRLIKKHLPRGYRETVRQRMILYEVPLRVYPDSYNGEPLCYAALASQKNYLSLYLMAAYGSPRLTRRLQERFRAAGKKLDMGKSCIHFQTENDLALGVIRDLIARTSVDAYIAIYRSVPRK